MKKVALRVNEAENAEGVENPSTSPGRLNPESEPNYSTIRQAIEEVPIAEILHYDRIPDYMDFPPDSLPLIVATPEGNFCVDGWSAVEMARREGQTHIRCQIDQMHAHNEAELALRKTAHRTAPRGGLPRFPEMIRNVCLNVKILLESDENLKFFLHGGARTGSNFSEDRKNNVCILLAGRLGKEAEKIKVYINYGEYIDNECLGYLITNKASKHFFEKVQPKKRTFKDVLVSKRLSDAEITKQVSEKMKVMFDTFKTDGTIPNIAEENLTPPPDSLQAATPVQQGTPNLTVVRTNQETESEDDSYQDEESTELEMTSDEDEDDIDPGITVEEVEEEVEEMIQDLQEVIDDPDTTIGDLATAIKEHAQSMLRLAARINASIGE
ncbi:MAG: hypothetical protein WCQ90_07850, partial [Deltaproteobacteria bacterium]